MPVSGKKRQRGSEGHGMASVIQAFGVVPATAVVVCGGVGGVGVFTAAAAAEVIVV